MTLDQESVDALIEQITTQNILLQNLVQTLLDRNPNINIEVPKLDQLNPTFTVPTPVINLIHPQWAGYVEVVRGKDRLITSLKLTPVPNV